MRVYLVVRENKHRGFETQSVVAIYLFEAHAEKRVEQEAIKHPANYSVEAWRVFGTKGP